MVRVYSAGPQASRLAWYDRNPAGKTDYYDAYDVAPHSVTTRVTYTVPTGKKAIVETMQCKARRTAVATTLGRARIYVWYIPSGGSGKMILDSLVYENTVGAKESTAIGATVTLFPGDQFDVRSLDLSTGGTFDYHGSYKLTEFVA